MTLTDILEAHRLWLSGEGGRRADLRGDHLYGVSLSGALLVGADLSGADLRRANLGGADLLQVNLCRADLREANLSEAKGVLSAVDYLKAHFERTPDGYIAYKTFNAERLAPDAWAVEPGAIIKENVNFDRCVTCGCGINVAPLKWVKRNYPFRPVWKVLIRWEWLAGVCVPYMTDGRTRCERVEVLEVVRGAANEMSIFF